MKSITTIHHELPMNVAKQILKSMAGTINATAIAYARGHLRFNAIENIADRKGADVPTIDDHADAMNALAEAENRNTVVADGMGFEVQMQSGELAENLMRLRDYYCTFLDQHKSLANDVPLSIAETVKFQMSRPGQNNDDMIETLALAVDIDPELLKAANLKMVTDDAADLKANAGKIITYLEGFTEYAAGETKEHRLRAQPIGYGDNETQIESMFDTLPAHVQFKLMSAAIRAHDKAQQKALMALLRGKLDAAGDIKMLKASRDELLQWLRTFTKVKQVQLNAYLERGGVLPAWDDHEIVTADTKPTKTASVTASVTGDKPQAERSLRRAPRPAAVN